MKLPAKTHLHTPGTLTPRKQTSLRRAAIAATLSQSRIFAGLREDYIAAIADISKTQTLKKNEMIFREGEKGENMFIIQTGQVSIHRIAPDGRKQVIHVFGPLDSFAEMVIATDEVYPADAVTLAPTLLILVPKDALLELLTRMPKLSLRLLASLSLHLKILIQSLHNLKGRQIESRLAIWLLQQRVEKDPDGTALITLPLSKKMLAAELGVTSETLSRTFARYRNECIITVNRNQIQLHDPGGLQAYADGRAEI